jgi:hypothetical protein
MTIASGDDFDHTQRHIDEWIGVDVARRRQQEVSMRVQKHRSDRH